MSGKSRTVTRGHFQQWRPRAGFAYRIRDNTVIRGGFGRFTQSSGVKGGQNGFSRSTPFIDSRDSRLTLYDTLSNPFREGILEPTGSSLGPLTNLGQGVNWINQNPSHPNAWEYSLQLQQEHKGWLFEVGFSHNKTYDLGINLQQNGIGFERWDTLRVPRFDATGRPLPRTYLTDEQIPNPFFQLPGVTGGRASSQLITIYDLLRPLKILGGQGRSDHPLGFSRYDALEAKIQRRFREGFSLLVAYTFSKLFEDVSFLGPEIAGPIFEHRPSDEDRPHKLSVAPIYELPIGRGKKWFGSMPRLADTVLGGWEISAQYTVQSGAAITFGTDSFYDGQPFGLGRSQRTLDRWFDTSHFVKFPNAQDDISLFPAWTGAHNLPGAGYRPSGPNDPRNGVYANFGNFVRRYPTRFGNVRASNLNELNFGLYKNFRVREGRKVQLRGEAFNAFNRPRFPGPETNPASANFGRVGLFQQNQSRVIQMALKVTF